ncbi:hypothetical protein ACFL56_01990 [Candidatus Margulisiibacteriota bacterium]
MVKKTQTTIPEVYLLVESDSIKYLIVDEQGNQTSGIDEVIEKETWTSPDYSNAVKNFMQNHNLQEAHIKVIIESHSYTSTITINDDERLNINKTIENRIGKKKGICYNEPITYNNQSYIFLSTLEKKVEDAAHIIHQEHPKTVECIIESPFLPPKEEGNNIFIHCRILKNRIEYSISKNNKTIFHRNLLNAYQQLIKKLDKNTTSNEEAQKMIAEYYIDESREPKNISEEHIKKFFINVIFDIKQTTEQLINLLPIVVEQPITFKCSSSIVLPSNFIMQIKDKIKTLPNIYFDPQIQPDFGYQKLMQAYEQRNDLKDKTKVVVETEEILKSSEKEKTMSEKIEWNKKTYIRMFSTILLWTCIVFVGFQIGRGIQNTKDIQTIENNLVLANQKYELLTSQKETIEEMSAAIDKSKKVLQTINTIINTMQIKNMQYANNEIKVIGKASSQMIINRTLKKLKQQNPNTHVQYVNRTEAGYEYAIIMTMEEKE